MKPLDYSLLRDIQKNELESTKLTSLEENFYANASEFLSVRKKEAFASGSTLSIREYENIKKILTTIKERREEKIILMAIRGEGNSGRLTPEEKKLLKELSDAVKKFRESIADSSASEESTLPVPEKKKVKLLKDVEPYKGLDNNVYGPYKSGDEVELPPAEAEWLLKAKMAEKR